MKLKLTLIFNIYLFIQKEEAEWFGLTEREAIQKQRLLEAETMTPVPLKHQLRLKFIEELKSNLFCIYYISSVFAVYYFYSEIAVTFISM